MFHPAWMIQRSPSVGDVAWGLSTEPRVCLKMGYPQIPGFIISFPKWLELGFYPHFQTRISDQFLENLAELRQQIAMFRIKQPGVGIMTMTWYDAV